MQKPAEILILSGARTPFTTWSRGINGEKKLGGALSTLDPFDLGAAALKGALNRAIIAPEELDKVIFGHAYHVGPNACYGARYVAHRANVPPNIPSLTVSLLCGTGLAAVITSAHEIAGGHARRIGAGGSDSSSLVPREIFIPSFKDISCGERIGKITQDLAEEYGISRLAQDQWAKRSHEAAVKAQKKGIFDEEIVSTLDIQKDDNILSSPEDDFFSAAKPLFSASGSVTGANTHGFVDGGSALILSSASSASCVPLGRYIAGSVVGVNPRQMAYAAVPAVRQCLEFAHLSISDIDLFEIHETFAAQVLINIQELAIPLEKVNVNGGAIALGHPFAGSGCRLILTLLKELKRRDLRFGIAAICAAGGLGTAVLVEAL
jgi:acetyl-CoA acetyltransferase family protein